MIIERNFHDELKQMVQEAERAVAEEEARMTPEQRMAEQKAKWEGLQRIWDHLEQQGQGKHMVPETVLQLRFVNCTQSHTDWRKLVLSMCRWNVSGQQMLG